MNVSKGGVPKPSIEHALRVAFAHLASVGLFVAACSSQVIVPQRGIDEDLTMRLEISLPAQAFDTTQAIPIQTKITYLGPNDREEVVGDNSPPVYFDLENVTGDLDMLGGVSGLMCEHTVLERGVALNVPYVKSGAFNGDDPDATFWRQFFEDKELHLPPGQWRVIGNLRTDPGGCDGPRHELSASVEFLVR